MKTTTYKNIKWKCAVVKNFLENFAFEMVSINLLMNGYLQNKTTVKTIGYKVK